TRIAERHDGVVLEGPPGQRPIGGADRLRRGAEEELHEVGRMAAEVGERPAYCGAGVEEPLREPLPALAARDGAGVRETHPAIADLAQSTAGDDVADGLRVAEGEPRQRPREPDVARVGGPH